MLDYLNLQLAERKQANLYRSRNVLMPLDGVKVQYKHKIVVSFCSNDYLGLANHPIVIKAFKTGVDEYGVGSGASQLIAGHRKIHQALESAFADFLQQERALLFSNGYMANLGVMTALTKICKQLYVDKYSHASLIDAALLTQTRFKRYKHNDIQHLQQLLTNSDSEQQQLIVTDSVFSMQGDLARLPGLIQLAAKNKAWLLVDDAHGIGILGKQGRGAVEHFGLIPTDVPILICSLGKAFGCSGAVVAGSEALIEFLIQHARTYIYTTAMPPALACAAKASLKLVQTETWRREKLFYLVNYFKNKIKQTTLPLLPSDTPIQALLVKDLATALTMSERLLEKGFLVTAIRPPTVPQHLICLRISFSCLHSEQQIDDLVNCLADIYDNLH